ncbi:MAG: hypothetical protein K2P65_09930 [Lachnospiraceae bacterium]|nr:hypothetical protein [Lachnospiraceae bacterium]
MKFTLEAYEAMLKKLSDKGYQFKNYKNWQESEKTVILRHDVDMNLEKAALLAEFENDVCQGKADATYYVLVSTDFYNIHSKASREYLRKIIRSGGNIGLHFDEVQYPISNEEEMIAYVNREIEILSNAIGEKVDTVSMHRPSEKVLSANIEFPGVINSYNEIYFKQMKYVSDSRRHWRENVDDIIEQAAYPRLHVLTHPVWYRRSQEQDLRETLKELVLHAALDRYDSLFDNFRDLGDELRRTEIEELIAQQEK